MADAFAAIMLATPAYPVGQHELHFGVVLGVRHTLVAVATMAPCLDPAWRYAPPKSIEQYARHARWLDHSENFDGAVVHPALLRLVHEQHGGPNPIGWARSATMWEACQGVRAYAVYAFAGDHLVAVVTSAAGSQIRLRRTQPSFPALGTDWAATLGAR